MPEARARGGRGFTGAPSRGTVICALVLLAVLATLLHEALFLGRGLVPADGILPFLPWSAGHHVQPSNRLLSDLYAVLLPIRQFIHDSVMTGDLPLWNPHLAGGIPALAGLQIAVFYPINLLLITIPPFTASGIASFLKLATAALGTLAFLRQAGASRPAALLGALVFTLCGFNTVWLGHPHTNASVLLPVLLWCIERAMTAQRLRSACVGLALTYGAVLLGGHPPTAVQMTLIAGGYALLRVPGVAPGTRLRTLACLAASLGAGILLSAISLLPFLEYYTLSSSALASARLDRTAEALVPAELVHFLLPLAGGSPTIRHEHLTDLLGLGTAHNFNERTAYAGVLTLFLALAAVVLRRDRQTAIHAGGGVLALTMVLGVPPWPLLFGALPVLDSVNPMRLLLLVDWCLAVLAALGLDSMLRAGAERRSRRLLPWFMLLLAITLAVVWRIVVEQFAALDATQRALLLGQLGMLAAGAAIACATLWPRAGARLVCALCVGWSAFDLLWFATSCTRTIEPALYYPTTGAIRFLQQETPRARFIGTGMILSFDTAAIYGIDDVRGRDFMTLRRYEELITGSAGNFGFYVAAPTLPAAFPLLNARHVLVPQRYAQDPPGFALAYDGEVAIYRYTDALDRAIAVPGYTVVPDPAKMLAVLRAGNFDARRTVLLEEEPAAPAPAVADPAPASETASTRILRYAPDEVVIEAELPHPGFVLLLDNHFPGWTARVNGQDAPIHRADYTFRAVAAPSGRSIVEFHYRPASFRLGSAVSILTLLALLLTLWRGRRAHAAHATADLPA